MYNTSIFVKLPVKGYPVIKYLSFVFMEENNFTKALVAW